MARWSEVRGYTLVLSHPRGPDRYARVALVTKRTLFGEALNVREARAEDTSRSGREPEALGLGRMLSWRWLGQGEAEELLSARLRTLETLGYRPLSGRADELGHRGAWDWLRDLVDRQLARSREEPPTRDDARDAGATSPPPAQRGAETLRASIESLGLEPNALLEGVATILEIPEAQLRDPSPATAAAVEPEIIAMLLPVWLEHEDPSLRHVGARWLAIPATPYELDREQLASWAASDGRLAEAVAPRLRREGLAMLGPESLLRLAHTARNPDIRNLAQMWRDRLT
ncbi:hypothetical protein G6O69_23615 [Pseudenhygromyxa sp. WMMC2535]|uniref:hypothetical protein n=1 Tax=Pseudenhygromyxa sp. WMMC2535 TaxID=2712867 RepID=UPI00155218E9|nr:hypothetical protein [Pseudenhygromyxa sp. WMMC2535]NVB40847.1 hypothetical protein [Pseudenhygromyxa sp. WMMC2535]